VVPVPASAVKLLNGRQMWFREPFGVKQSTRSSVPKQFTNLEELVKAWGNNTLQVQGPYRDIGRSIQRLVSWIMTKRYMFSELYWYSRRVVARFSYNALCFPDDMKRMEYQLSSYPLMADSIFSAISYININGSTPLSMPLELIESAWAIHDDFNDLNDRFTYIRNAVQNSVYKDHYSRKDIFKMAVAASADRTGFLSYLTTKMIDEDEIKSIQMPGDKFVTVDFKDRVTMVEDFMNGHIRGFGIYENFIYSPSPSYATNTYIKRYLKPQDPSRAVTYLQLQDMLSIESYGPMLREARLNNIAIEFKLAINFTVKYVDVWKTRPGPLRLPTSGNVLSTSELSIDLTTNDVIINDNLSDIADYGVFPWVVSELPFIGHDVSYFTSMIGTIRTPKRDIELAPKPTFFMAYNT